MYVSSFLVIFDAWIDQAIKQIDKKIDHDKNKRDNQNSRLDDRIITESNRFIDVTPNSRPTENGFRQNSTAKQQPHLETDNRQYRNDGIFKRMFVNYPKHR